MPGGSVNGRPFRESRDSYSRTGIPCGNPRRYKSHEVVRMEPTGRTRSEPLEAPGIAVETAGQRQLQELLRRQLDTSGTLQQRLSQKKQFSAPATHRPSTADLSGMVTLGGYQSLEKTDAYIEEMKGYGITEDELLYKLQSEDGPGTSKTRKLASREYHEATLANIDKKIANRKKSLSIADTYSNAKSLSRHEMELEKTIAGVSDQSQFLHTVLIREKAVDPAGNPDEPMNKLPEILQSISGGRHKRNKHKRDDSYKNSCTLECCMPDKQVTMCSACSNNTTLAKSDTESTTNKCTHCESCNTELPVQTCAERPTYLELIQVSETSTQSPKQTCSTEVSKSKHKTKSSHIFSWSFTVAKYNLPKQEDTTEHDDDLGERRKRYGTIKPIPGEVIKMHKLSQDGIKIMPRFVNYSPGLPSNVLYLKNLGSKVTEEDLVALFLRFQADDSHRIVFQLLSGRMKGQAFVTFPDQETARAAMTLVNGYDFKNKPIIIAYGKQPKSKPDT